MLPTCEATTGATTLPPQAVAAELHAAVDDPGVDGVIAAVGGWTMVSVLPHLDLQRVGDAAKPIVGYSDVTSLLNAVTSETGLITYHGPMIVSEWGEAKGPWDFTRDEFFATVGKDGREQRHLPSASRWSDELLWWDSDDDRPRRPRESGELVRGLRDGVGEGPLWGGSLLSLGLLMGTPFGRQPEGAVVFLEAEALAPDELLARLMQLRLAGVFESAVAVVLGKIGRPSATASGFRGFDDVVRAALPSGIPVAAGYDIGHTEPMLTLPVGGRARVVVDAGQSRFSLG